MLQGIAEGLGDSARRSGGGQEFGAIRNRPEREQRPDARGRVGPRGVVWDQREIAQTQALPEAFVVREDEGLVFDDRTAGGGAKHVALEVRDVAVIEKVARVEGAVAHEFVERRRGIDSCRWR